MEQKDRLDRVSFILLLITTILTPLIFIPTVYVPLDMMKAIIITFGILISGIIFFFNSLKKNELYVPKHPLFLISCGIILSTIISTLLSHTPMKSFLGQGFEIGTASFIMVLFLASLLTIYLTNKDRDRVLYVYISIVSTFAIIALFHISRLIFGADFLTLNVFQSSISSMIGRWKDLALFSGAVGILSYIGIRFVSLSGLFKILLLVLIAVSGLLLFVVNSVVIWGVVCIILLLIASYEYYIAPTESTGLGGVFSRLPLITCALLIISVICFTKTEAIGNFVFNNIKINQAEISLPWQLTLDVAADSIKESPIFGAGPNRFDNQYLKFKPLIVNQTVFWNTEFNNGFATIPTVVVTQGLIGLLLWIIFIIVFITTGFKALVKENDNWGRFFIASSFFSSLFLWIATLVYTPSHSVMFLTFIFTGLFIASLIKDSHVSLVKLGESENSSLKRFIPLILTIMIALTILWLAAYAKKIVALGYFQGGISYLNLPDNKGLPNAESDFKKALTFDKSDAYYQALSEINILKISALVQQIQNDQATQKTTTPNADSIAKINSLIAESMAYTTEAIKLDPENYYNYIAESRISELAMSLQVPGAYENTKAAYNNALKYNPFSALIYLSIARLEASKNNFEDAQKNIGLALQLKQDYVDAIFLLSQIQVAQGKIKDAIISVQVASQINPNSPSIFFQLGLLEYNDKNYQEAVNAFNQAVKLDNTYANAQYFLGLSYARIGKMNDAVIQFEKLAQTNPENQEVALILSNLKEGKSPFADAKPPVDNKPEQRKNLPIKK